MAADLSREGLIEAAKRIFAIQEERKALYTKLKRAQEDYVGSVDTNLSSALSRYKSDVASITTSFSSLSQELIEIGKTFKEQNRNSVSHIITEIQCEEKKHLQLTVQYNIDTHTNQTTHESDDEDHDKSRDLKRELLHCQLKISSLLEDLRYECEDLLLQSK